MLDTTNPPPANEQRPHYAALHPAFQHQTFLIRRKFFSFLGAKLHVFDSQENVVMFCQLQAFKLKEDIRIYTDETKTQQILAIRARSIMDFGATYDVFDTTMGGEMHVGSLKRKALKSLIRDEWELIHPNGQPIGMIQEDSGSLAIVRRLIEITKLFLPQQYMFSIQGNPVGSMKQTFNPFIMKMTADFHQDTAGYLDRRLAAAAATLLCVIEGKQG